MDYTGKLYGRVSGAYFDTGKTTNDWDRLWNEPAEKLKEYYQRLNEVLDTNGQLTKEDLQLCLGYTCESLLEDITK